MNRYKVYLLCTLSIFLILSFSGCFSAEILGSSEDDEIVYEKHQNNVDCIDSNQCPYVEKGDNWASIDSVVFEQPVLLAPMPPYTIAVGEFHSLVIVDGSLWAWGNNWHGQLGDGTTNNHARPVLIGTDTNWEIVAVGGGHTVAIKDNGSLWAWGYNWHGQLGDGTTENRTIPVQIGPDTDWAGVFAGSDYTIAIKTDGSLWAWGRNSSGQLGDGTTDDRLVPTQIGVDIDWVRVMPDAVHTLALKNDGSLWFWGSNLYIYFDSRSPRFASSSLPVEIFNTPVQIGTYDDWIRMIEERSWHREFQIRDDGSLWALGNNSEGQLGDGTTITRNTFVQIGTDTDWVSVVAGGSRTVAMKTDGSVWSWGWAGRRTHCYEMGMFLSLSMIGDGGNEDRHSPVKIIEGLNSLE